MGVIYSFSASGQSFRIITPHFSFCPKRTNSYLLISTGSFKRPISTVPFSILSLISSAIPLQTSNITFGFSFLNDAANFATPLNTQVSPLPMVIVPISISSLCDKSSLIFSSIFIISCARCFNSIPSSVSDILCFPRLNNFTPSSSSICISCLDKVGCVTFSLCAALVIFSSRATIKKYFNTLSSIVTSEYLFFILVYHNN